MAGVLHGRAPAVRRSSRRSPTTATCGSRRSTSRGRRRSTGSSAPSSFPPVGVLARARRRSGSRTRRHATAKADTSEQYTVALGVSSWELDLFGRVRSLEAAALEQYLATEQAGRAAQTGPRRRRGPGLPGAAPPTPTACGSPQATLEAQQASLALIQKSRDLGVASDLELSQIQSQVEAARADVAALHGAPGRRPERPRRSSSARPSARDLLPDGLVGGERPAPRLGRASRRTSCSAVPTSSRPSTSSVSANANIGAARAAFFPRISLTVGVGSVSTELSRPVRRGNGHLELRAADRGAALHRRRRHGEGSRSRRSTARSPSPATRRRSSRPSPRSRTRSRCGRRSSSSGRPRRRWSRPSRTTYRLSEARYKAGLDGYLGVLVAQRSLFAAQQALVGRAPRRAGEPASRSTRCSAAEPGSSRFVSETTSTGAAPRRRGSRRRSRR